MKLIIFLLGLFVPFFSFGSYYANDNLSFNYTTPLDSPYLVDWFPFTLQGAQNSNGVNGWYFALTGFTSTDSSPCWHQNNSIYWYWHFFYQSSTFCPSSLISSSRVSGAYWTLDLNISQNNHIKNALASSTWYTLCVNVKLPYDWAYSYTSSTSPFFLSESIDLFWSSMNVGWYIQRFSYWKNTAIWPINEVYYWQFPYTNSVFNNWRANYTFNDSLWHFVCYSQWQTPSSVNHIAIDWFVYTWTTWGYNSFRPSTINLLHSYFTNNHYFWVEISDFYIFNSSMSVQELWNLTRTFQKSNWYTIVRSWSVAPRYYFPGQSFFDESVNVQLDPTIIQSSDYSTYIIGNFWDDTVLSIDPFIDQFITFPDRDLVDEIWTFFPYWFTWSLLKNDPTDSSNSYGTWYFSMVSPKGVSWFYSFLNLAYSWNTWPWSDWDYLDCSNSFSGSWGIRSSVFRDIEETVNGQIWRKFNSPRYTKSCIRKNTYTPSISVPYVLYLPDIVTIYSPDGVGSSSDWSIPPEPSLPWVSTPIPCVSDGSWINSMECGVQNIANSITSSFNWSVQYLKNIADALNPSSQIDNFVKTYSWQISELTSYSGETVAIEYMSWYIYNWEVFYSPDGCNYDPITATTTGFFTNVPSIPVVGWLYTPLLNTFDRIFVIPVKSLFTIGKLVLIPDNGDVLCLFWSAHTINYNSAYSNFSWGDLVYSTSKDISSFMNMFIMFCLLIPLGLIYFRLIIH